MELKEGMYVKINGFISKIGKLHTSKKGQTYMQFKQPNGMLADMNIKIYDGKASYNITDLIEVGDYVNGVMVESVNNSIKPIAIPQYKNEYGEYVDFDESDIKSIVTKEQFEAIKYEVK